jgi:WD40 repeat protein
MSTRSAILFVIASLALVAGQAMCGEPPAVEKRADTAPQGIDTCGDLLPQGAFARLGTLRFRPGDESCALTLAPDGKTAATGEMGRVRLWDLASGKEVREFHFPGMKEFYKIRFSPDGQLLAAVADHWGAMDCASLFVCEVGTGTIRHEFGKGQSGFNDIDFAAGGKLLLARETNRSRQIVLWDTANGKEVRRLPEVRCCACSPNGRLVAGGGEEGTVLLWDVATGEEVRQLRGHRSAVRALAFSPDGSTLASGGGMDGTIMRPVGEKPPPDDTAVRLWDVATGRPRTFTPDTAHTVRSLRFSPEGGTLAVGCDEGLSRSVTFWDVGTGRKRRRVSTVILFPPPFTFSSDGKTLAWTEGGCMGEGVIHIEDFRACTEEQCWRGAPRWPSELAFTPDGKTLLAGGGCLRALDIATGRERSTEEGHRAKVCQVAFSPDGKAIASLDKDQVFRVWDVSGGRLPPAAGLDGVCRFGFSTDGKTLAAVRADASVRVWEATSGRTVVEFRVGPPTLRRTWEENAGRGKGDLDLNDRPRCCVVFGAGCKMLAVAGAEGDVGVWETSTGRQLGRVAGSQEWGSRMAFSPDGSRLITVGKGERLRVWDMADFKEIYHDTVRSSAGDLFAFSVDGRLLAWDSGKGVQMWDLRARKPAGRLASYAGGIVRLAFDRGGTTLATAASGETALCLWDVATGRELRRLAGKEYSSVEWHSAPDGRLLASTSDSLGGDWFVREVATGRLVTTTDWGHGPLEVVPDGRTVVQWKENGWKHTGTLVFTEVVTGSVLAELPAGHRGPITAPAFSPDGRTLATGSSDTTVLLWDWRRVGGLWPRPEQVPGGRQWADLAGDNAAEAQRAVALFLQSPREALAILEKSLPPATPIAPARIAGLVADLDHEEFARRQQASQELTNLGEQAAPAMRKALAGASSPEARRRLADILESIGVQAPSPEWLRAVRALQVLEGIDTPEARQFLDKLARGAPEARLTQEARAVLERLAKRR